ncbi:RcnB family protein [Gluconobacter sp. Dm-74]|uniref:RcnB family protein n=1 Tax=Gluconobacter sp. Dm-74 TaxID=2799803 RepID=UPI001B8B0A6F|nr:RcnB family protein [Gluconobacter sp. Dm-74]MBS1090602.1 RcnB family protein [Gluconobacter sp. Dm-74]
MKTKLFAGLMAGCLLAAAPLASADPRNSGPQGGPGWHDGPGRNGDYRGGGRRGGPDRVWRRGDRYDGPRGNRWAVNNWRSYRGLYAPPPGYYWTRSGNQFLLTALATGLIAGVVGANIAAPPPGAPPPPPPGYGPGPR